mmetsp:Transcript_26173/g.44670  ORF Transcript_26173/g.44670 Transcript_26173/m.44670 type:complete len:512 (-) Transcript_26173:96-1631(-)
MYSCAQVVMVSRVLVGGEGPLHTGSTRTRRAPAAAAILHTPPPRWRQWPSQESAAGSAGLLPPVLLKQTSSSSSSSSSRSEGDCAPTISNGVLGYESALPGEPFLKIGVGALLKGSCPACTENWGSADPYHFNSPYAFARDHGWLQDNATLSTEWAVLSPSSKAEEAKRVVVMEQTVVLDPSKKKGQGRVRSGSSSSSGSTGSKLGYRLRKTVRVEGSVLTVTSELTNLGEQPFTTPFYSHHLFSVDGIAIGKGYTAVLQGLPPTSSFAEPGVALNQTTGKFDAGWAAPLKSVATVTGGGTVTMAREPSLLPDGSSEKVKAEFQLGGGASPISNAFSLSYAPSGGGASSGVAVSEEVLGSGHLPFSTRRNDPPPELLAYNIYIERGTLSPEPVFLVGPLGAGGSATWVQRLTFSQFPAGGAAPDSNQGQLSTDKAQEVAKEGASERLLPAAGAQRSLLPLFFLLVACGAAVAAASYLTRYLAPQRRKAYVTIPETPRIAETELRESPQRQR